MEMNMHGVVNIELCRRYVSNSGCRKIRITGTSWNGSERVLSVVEMFLYGETGILEALPRSTDFADYDLLDAATAPLSSLTASQVAEIEAEAEASVMPVAADEADMMASAFYQPPATPPAPDEEEISF